MTRTYIVCADLDLYDSGECAALATQVQTERMLLLDLPNDGDRAPAYPVRLCEDDYLAWISTQDLQHLQSTTRSYQSPQPSALDIAQGISAAIAFAEGAMTQPNYYLWGGTLGPNYDCSGLMQHAFSTQGIWLPRDAYQQESFVQAIPNLGAKPEDILPQLQPGDLLFFGTPLKATHVALYLGEGRYIHSSGRDQGRNGIGIDELSATGHFVGQAYYAQFRGAGRVVASYQPRQQTWL